MWRGLASLLAKLAARNRKNIRLYRSEPLPSSGDPNFRYLPGDERAFGHHFGQWFTPDKEFVKWFPGLSPDASRGIKSIVIPRKDLQKYNAVNAATDIDANILTGNKEAFNLVDDVGEVILPPELAMKAKYNFFDSLRYLFETPYISAKDRALHGAGRSTDWIKDKIKLEKQKPQLGLKRLFELLKLKAQGKKSGGIVSLML